MSIKANKESWQVPEWLSRGASGPCSVTCELQGSYIAAASGWSQPSGWNVLCCVTHSKGRRLVISWAIFAFAAEGGPLQEWASQKGLPSDLPSICRNDEARKWVLDQLNVTAKESKLKVSDLLSQREADAVVLPSSSTGTAYLPKNSSAALALLYCIAVLHCFEQKDCWTCSLWSSTSQCSLDLSMLQ